MPRYWCTRGAFASHSFLRAVAVTAGQQPLTLVSEPLPLPLLQTARPRFLQPPFRSWCPLPRGHRTKNAVQSVHLRSAMGEGSILCTPGRRRTKMDGSGASGFSLKSYCSAIRVLQNVVVWRVFFTFYTEKNVLSQSSCIFVHGMSSDGNKCARCRTRAPRGPMKITASRIPLLGDVLIGTTVCTRIDPYRRINSLHRKQ